MNVKQKILSFIAIVSIFVAIPILSSRAVLADCGGAPTSIIDCKQGTGGKTPQDTGIWGILVLALNILTAGIGIAAVGGIVWASILYASASDNAQQTKQAKDIIKNVVIGVIAYGGMYLLLNFLIPGGIFT